MPSTVPGNKISIPDLSPHFVTGAKQLCSCLPRVLYKPRDDTEIKAMRGSDRGI